MRLIHILKAVIFSILSFKAVSSENILFLSLPYFGHLQPMVRIAEQLVPYGHTSFITIPEKFGGKFGPVKKGVNFVTIDEYPELAVFNAKILKVLLDHEQRALKESFEALHKLFERYLLNENLFSKLKSLNASLAIIDSNFMSNPFAIFAYRLKIPFVLVGLHNQINIHRTPWAISITPHFFIIRAKVTSFSMKLRNVWAHLQDYINPAAATLGRKIKDYAPERPDISFDDLIRQFVLYIVDSDHFLHVPSPALPNVKYIGGLAVRPAEPLHGEMKDFVKASKNGIIVVSPGTVVNWDMSLNKMADAFSKIKYDVVWKHSNFSTSHQNVLIRKWLPQNDLLGQSNTKLFISHCGNNGQHESLYHAVPLICFPRIADQIFNARYIQGKRYGVMMDIESFTVEELVGNIKKVIENPVYKANIARTSEIFRSRKELPSQRAARYVNEVIKYGGEHLRSELQDVPLYEFLMLDVWGVVVTVCIGCLSLACFIIKKCFAMFCSVKKRKTE